VSLLLGYNTSGFAHHRLEDALDLIAAAGFRAVALTPDVHHVPAPRLGDRLRALGLLPVVETGARFLLDPERKHFPTFFDPGRQRRIDFLYRCIDLAAGIGAPCVSLWSGRGSGEARLVEGLTRVCDRAGRAGVDVAFEPEPGMAIDTMARFDALRAKLPHPRLALTLDVGHLHCLEEGSPASWIDRYAPLLRNVHLDDHRRGVHEHLFFGDGEIDWPPVTAALHRAAGGRTLPATVELPRHSHDAVETCRRAALFLATRTSPGARPSS